MDRKIRSIELDYPRVSGNINAIEIELNCVRAANSILIEYDFNRDGWKISMPSKTWWEVDDKIQDPCYQEMAFISAWAVGDDAPWDEDEED